MKNKILSIFFSILLFIFIPCFSYAATGSFSAYTSVMNNNTQAKQIYELWSTHSNYDPVFDWVIFPIYDSNTRITDYILAASDSLSFSRGYISSTSDTYVIKLYNVSATQTVPQHYNVQYDTYDSIIINVQNFNLLGTLQNCSLPDFADNQKYNYIVSVLIVLLCFCFLFFIFRIRFDRDRGFRL